MSSNDDKEEEKKKETPETPSETPPEKPSETETQIVDLDVEGSEEEPTPSVPKESTFRRLKAVILVLVISGAVLLMWGVTKFDLLNLKETKVWEKLPFIGKKEAPKKKEEEAVQILPRVKVYKAAKQDFKDILKSIGTIQGSTEANLKFETNGIVESFYFREGDIVRRGEVIAELEHYDSALKVKFRSVKIEGAQTAVEAAQHKYRTHKKLFDIGAIIEDKLEEVRWEVEKAKADLRASQVELESAKSEVEKTYLLALHQFERNPLKGDRLRLQLKQLYFLG